jgi:hypothetical protein
MYEHSSITSEVGGIRVATGAAGATFEMHENSTQIVER